MTQQEQDQARYLMWRSLIPGYESLNRNQKKKAKLEFCMDNDFSNPYKVECPSYFSSCETTTMGHTHIISPQQENNMYAQAVVNTNDEIAMQRKYLTHRLNSIWYALDDKLQRQYFLRVDPPKTAEEMVQKIKDGKYTIEPLEDGDADSEWSFWEDRFSWRAPDQKLDRVGYNKAKDAMEKRFQAVRDAITIADPKDALKLLQQLEN